MGDVTRFDNWFAEHYDQVLESTRFVAFQLNAHRDGQLNEFRHDAVVKVYEEMRRLFAETGAITWSDVDDGSLVAHLNGLPLLKAAQYRACWRLRDLVRAERRRRKSISRAPGSEFEAEAPGELPEGTSAEVQRAWEALLDADLLAATCVYLVDIETMTEPEVAAQLDLPRYTVHRRKLAGRDFLNQWLRQEGYGHG